MKPHPHRKEIKEAVGYIFYQTDILPQKRFIVAKAYCKGIDGVREYGTKMDGLCSHLECNNCREFELELKKQVNNYGKE